MPIYIFCSACGCRSATDALFCDVCGHAFNGKPSITPSNTNPFGATALGSFFASQATLCLVTLLIFLGLVVALAPAGWRYASLQLKPGGGSNVASSDTRSLGTGNAPARCNQLVVIFNATATIARVSALLEQLDTTIAFGPNENGAFELSTPATSAAGVAEALNRASDAVVSASLQRRCL